MQVLSRLVQLDKLVGGNPGLHVLILCLLDQSLFEKVTSSPFWPNSEKKSFIPGGFLPQESRSCSTHGEGIQNDLQFVVGALTSISTASS